MSAKFDIQSLCSTYDRGWLVPFIGAGMSMPACPDWPTFVGLLEQQAGFDLPAHDRRDPVERALFALQVIRHDGRDLVDAISKAIYSGIDRRIPPQAVALASIVWPLICTTNYDDIYLEAKRLVLQAAEKLNGPLPRLLGRGEADCRQVLRHINFPVGEAIWALQGLLPPRAREAIDILGPHFDKGRFAAELVVGHAEYRSVAHRAQHFRRSFAELFRARSFLFLGSGLAEPYFLSLFDEIIELTGPPVRPHFAMIQEGDLDPEFMRQRYHIICNTYPRAEHERVTQLLKEFRDYQRRQRARPTSWGFRVAVPSWLSKESVGDQFKVIRGSLPNPDAVSADEAVAISCGRAEASRPADETERLRGRAMVSPSGAKMLGLRDKTSHWENDWLVKLESVQNSYGIVARELIASPGTSRDRRSPEAVRNSFKEFLCFAKDRHFRTVHVQLLAAGELRVFEPWISLVQMARAYGEWFRENKVRSEDCVIANIYVVDSGTVALVEGGYVDLVRELEGTAIHLSVDVIDAVGAAERHHLLVGTSEPIASLVGKRRSKRDPMVYALPTPAKNSSPRPLEEVSDQSVREFGLVSGSTLVVDFHQASRVGPATE
jgi:hypothetical protein